MTIVIMDNFELGKGLHLTHLNIRSLTGGNKLDMFKAQLSDSGIDIFALSETWLSEAIPNNIIEVPSYTVSRLDRSWHKTKEYSAPKRGGGLAMYVKEGIQFSDTKYEGMYVSCKDLEMQWISVKVNHIRPILVDNVYRPPQGDYKKCCNLITEPLNRADLNVTSEVYICGDFNIDYAKELTFTMKALGLTQVINSPTRTHFRNGMAKSSLLDMIFTNSEHVKAAKTLDLNLSDHLAILVTRKKTWIKPKKVSFRDRSYKNYNKEVFQDRLTETNWVDFFRQNDPNILWESLKNSIVTVADQICPMRDFKVPEAREPWVTNEMLEAIKDKDSLLKKSQAH